MAETVKLEPDWLDREIARTKAEVDQWPAWFRNRPKKQKLPPTEHFFQVAMKRSAEIKGGVE